MTQAAPTIVLWDIDNTLLYTGGAGSLAMARAFRHLYGIDDAFRRIEFSGRTDTAIFSDAARAHGIAEERIPSEIARFLAVYLPHLEETLTEVTGGRLMPGIDRLLEKLHACDDVVQGLGTGNFRPGGAMKLRHFGIDRYFPNMAGGFGEDSEDRARVLACGIERLRDGDGRPRRVVVIGDTPHDVRAAHANGACALAVATGRHSVDELRAAGADDAAADLGDVERVLRAIRG
ncbi:MAG: haloacid dehalogenase-like hydrolase [Dehalococcoidia bacterium]|nr:haloacid dehalogenase-like hydrolase [Dehalococcoidia bacterium]